jgi:hypothetical protein
MGRGPERASKGAHQRSPARNHEHARGQVEALAAGCHPGSQADNEPPAKADGPVVADLVVDSRDAGAVLLVPSCLNRSG